MTAWTKLAGRAAAVVVVMAGATQHAAAATLSDLFGTWTGVWTIQAEFDENGPAASGQPLPREEPIQFDIRAFDPAVNNFGTVSFTNPDQVPATITELTVMGNVVDISIVSDGFSATTPSAFVHGILGGQGPLFTLTGTYTEAVIPTTIAASGVLVITNAPAVPEPASWALSLAGLLLVGATAAQRRQA